MAIHSLIDRKKKSKSQFFYGDFVIAMLIFTAILIIYFNYRPNIPNQFNDVLNELIFDSKTVSLSLTHGGYPFNWNGSNVNRIGITNNDNRINSEKFNAFLNINYNKTKKLLGTNNNFMIFFENETGELINIEGYCGYGTCNVETSYDEKAAYYYRKDDDTFLKSFMEETFNADIYHDEGGQSTEFFELVKNLDNYSFIVLEHAFVPNDKLDSVKMDLENYVNDGRLMMISGELATQQSYEIFDVEFWKKTGQATKNQNATVIAEDEFLTFNIGENITFAQAYYIINKSIEAENFNEIARFFYHKSFNKDNNAIARWSYGQGEIFFFSDFDASHFSGKFQEILEIAVRKWIDPTCTPINKSSINLENLVKIDRLLIYNNEIVRMVLYLCE